jgi:hypothetical protein
VFEHDGTPYPGFPFNAGGNITTSPALGDIDNDGRVEIVFGASLASNNLFALRHDLTQPPGWPVSIQLNEDLDSSPALGDLTGDAIPDVAIGGSNGTFWVFRGTNGSVSFYRDVLDNLGVKVPIRSSPVLADVDGDGSIDIVVGDQNGRVHGWSTLGGLGGTDLPGFPIQTGGLIEGGTAVWDVDGDGLTEVVATSFDQSIFIWDTPWTFDASRAPWPMFKRDHRHSGNLESRILDVTGVPDAVDPARPLLFQNAPNPFGSRSTVIRYQVPEGAAYRHVDLAVFDLNGRLVKTIVNGEQPPGVHELSWDGTDLRGRNVASGIYPYRLRVADRSFTRKMVLIR